MTNRASAKRPPLSDNPLGLQGYEKYIIPLNKPTAESQNYRLYLRLK